LVRVFLVYDTRYGNTKLVAEKIVEGMKEAEGIETDILTLKYLKEVWLVTINVVLQGDLRGNFLTF